MEPLSEAEGELQHRPEVCGACGAWLLGSTCPMCSPASFRADTIVENKFSIPRKPDFVCTDETFAVVFVLHVTDGMSSEELTSIRNCLASVLPKMPKVNAFKCESILFVS